MRGLIRSLGHLDAVPVPGAEKLCSSGFGSGSFPVSCTVESKMHTMCVVMPLRFNSIARKIMQLRLRITAT
jgi:hypothetical protein